ncbi:hypothetical protein OIU84_016840 [Salix udensis]|uniref:Inhibitor I9 domain-containing protein n=1 Tax=Salix udensis TaxID=889485 RepID=A0AAD6NQT2_9ROSI|nr:hypothetical protein OIU84_016840 [Salix udensis]
MRLSKPPAISFSHSTAETHLCLHKGEHSISVEINYTPYVVTLIMNFLDPSWEVVNSLKMLYFYSYTRHINGFAATLEDEVAAEIAKHPEVVSVFLNQGRKKHTTHSWSFLGLEKDGVVPSGSIWKKARFGEDTIIGNLDTGAWPESESFSDEGLGPIPSKWKGICQNGSDPGFHCNRFLPLVMQASSHAFDYHWRAFMKKRCAE